jgi:hypothetical protein
VVLSGISTPFGELFRAPGKITHVLRTRAPLYSPLRAFSLDLHVLGTPPAFVLSQDQTLQLRDFDPCLSSRQKRLLRGTWHGVLRINCCKLKECGTAFRRRLAIQISKTEPHPSEPSISASNPSLDRRGSREDDRSASKGRWIYFHLPALSRRSGEANAFDGFPTAGTRLLSREPCSVKGLYRTIRASASPRAGAASTPAQELRQGEKSGGASASSDPSLRSSALLLSARRRPVKNPATGPLPSSRAPLTRARDVLPLPISVKRRPAQGVTQRATSSRPRRRPSTARAPSRSSRPADRARSCATIAPMWRRAASRSSFTTR